MDRKRVTIPQLTEWKKNQRKITALTAYDYTFARLLDESGIDVILVGDSAGMVAMGYENTLPVTMDEMIHYTRGVRRGVQQALLVGDMPFMSYHTSAEDTIRNAGRFIQEGGAEAVKMEGGSRVLDKISAVIQAGISVMGHVGLTPQSVHQFGGYRVQGKNYLDARQIKKDGLDLQKAGVFSLVLEGIPMDLAAEITAELKIPTIGIGAGPHCDGQILVTQDMLGMNLDFAPKFVKKYGELGTAIRSAVQDYVDEVQSGGFPDEAHSYHLKKEKLRSVGNDSR
ncbi:MAG: 3-methyl-2-oxobutanoate hydroxymethyltransferase [Nitrospinae bacterium]|nr:3-methyl-2-oxobutanoate hydroxymethyltransferase [Nitrospinota bacterium]